jgi:hypothetical protein
VTLMHKSSGILKWQIKIFPLVVLGNKNDFFSLINNHL